MMSGCSHAKNILGICEADICQKVKNTKAKTKNEKTLYL